MEVFFISKQKFEKNNPATSGHKDKRNNDTTKMKVNMVTLTDAILYETAGN